jgi:homoserine O-acetyltransferase
MDSHHLARKRGGDLMTTLATIKTPTFIIGINSDILCPLDEQRFMEQHMPNAKLIAIDSLYGHDGFIIEGPQISNLLKSWLVSQNV